MANYDSIIDFDKSKFDKYGNLVEAVIKDGVTTIGEWAFLKCYSLTHITIPDSVTSIGNSAFFDCKSLTSITIPNSVTYMGGYTFSNCSILTSVTISDNVKRIGLFTFLGCSSLPSIEIPDSVTSIGRYAFSGCTSLKNYKNRYFKITNADMSCLRRHYTMNKWYYIKGEPKICERGFHACTRPTDCFGYYSGDVNWLRFFEVELGDIIDEDYSTSKVCSNKIKFIKEYTFKEFIELSNNS